MELIIRGGHPLHGVLRVEGAKNAALPALCASLLTDAPLVLRNVPDLEDVRTMATMLVALGKAIERVDEHTYRITSQGELRAEAPYELVRRMRASFLVLGPLLARLGRARVPLPGGCVLGARPVDLHLKGLRRMGAQIELHKGDVDASGRLHGAEIYLDYPSVGATEQLLLAAASVPEKTVIHNPAREPEVEDLISLLRKMGAEVELGPSLVIRGKSQLDGAEHTIIPDRINTGTYLIAGAITGGEVEIGCRAAHLRALLEKLRECGATLEVDKEKEKVKLHGPERPRALELETRPYPGFPTDLQPQFTALLALAEGESLVRETVFPQRFSHVPELLRLGAEIKLADSSAIAIIKGVGRLEGATVQAPDIRAGAALVLAGLAAEGETIVQDEGHLARGYSDIVRDLRALGAAIERRE